MDLLTACIAIHVVCVSPEPPWPSGVALDCLVSEQDHAKLCGDLGIDPKGECPNKAYRSYLDSLAQVVLAKLAAFETARAKLEESLEPRLVPDAERDAKLPDAERRRIQDLRRKRAEGDEVLFANPEYAKAAKELRRDGMLQIWRKEAELRRDLATSWIACAGEISGASEVGQAAYNRCTVLGVAAEGPDDPRMPPDYPPGLSLYFDFYGLVEDEMKPKRSLDGVPRETALRLLPPSDVAADPDSGGMRILLQRLDGEMASAIDAWLIERSTRSLDASDEDSRSQRLERAMDDKTRALAVARWEAVKAISKRIEQTKGTKECQAWVNAAGVRMFPSVFQADKVDKRLAQLRAWLEVDDAKWSKIRPLADEYLQSRATGRVDVCEAMVAGCTWIAGTSSSAQETVQRMQRALEQKCESTVAELDLIAPPKKEN